MRHFIIIVTINCFLLTGSAQNSLRDIMSNLPDVTPVVANGSMPVKTGIPCDFSRLISSGFIGISDAKVDSATAVQQAFLRALSVFSLKQAYGCGMSDFFNDGNEGSTSSNYEEFCKIKARLNLPISAIKIAECLKLQSGEVIMCLSIDTTNQNSAERMVFESNVEVYYKETTDEGRIKTSCKINIRNEEVYSDISKNHVENLTFFLSNNRWVNQASVLDSVELKNKPFKYFYLVAPDCKTDTIGFNIDKSFGTTDGLWFALANSIYSQLTAQLKPQFLHVKQVGDRYQNKLTSLNRESGFFRFNTTLTNGIYFENKLEMRIATEFPTLTVHDIKP